MARAVSPGTVPAVMHQNRHLGELACRRGLQGLRGTAAR
jgi:hypothetical protein